MTKEPFLEKHYESWKFVYESLYRDNTVFMVPGNLYVVKGKWATEQGAVGKYWTGLTVGVCESSSDEARKIVTTPMMFLGACVRSIYFCDDQVENNVVYIFMATIKGEQTLVEIESGYLREDGTGVLKEFCEFDCIRLLQKVEQQRRLLK